MQTFLVVDDEPAVLTVLRRQLAAPEREVVTASSGEEALERLRQGGVDLLLTDLAMPGLGGLDVVAAARAADDAPAVVVMTGQASVDNAVESLKRGAGDFLRKPFDRAALEAAVAQALAARADRARDPEAEAGRLRSEFLALVGHELRTPLTVVLGWAAVLREGALGEVGAEQARALDLIGREAERLHQALESILELARARAASAKPETFAVAALLREAAAARKAEARARGLSLWVEAPPGLRLRGERGALLELVARLVDNAVKFTPCGGVLLTAEAAPDGVRLEVRDTGSGLREADVPRAFREFTQLEPTLTRSHGGLGLGLALCARLARRLGAVLRLAPRPAGGCCASLTLPAPQDAAKEESYG